MIKSEQKAIGDRGYTYTVRQFGAREGGRMLVFLGKLLGKPIGDAVSGGKSLDLETAGRVISGLADAVSEQDFDHLVNSFAKHTDVTGGTYGAKSLPLHTEGVLDLHFAGAYGELLQWLAFAVEANYASFFAGLGGGKVTDLVSALRVSEPPNNESPSPSPST
jgi:hypothetical protein